MVVAGLCAVCVSAVSSEFRLFLEQLLTRLWSIKHQLIHEKISVSRGEQALIVIFLEENVIN
jgi:hypothetical protein